MSIQRKYYNARYQGRRPASQAPTQVRAVVTPPVRTEVLAMPDAACAVVGALRRSIDSEQEPLRPRATEGKGIVL
jgi:hypothetical protein